MSTEENGYMPEDYVRKEGDLYVAAENVLDDIIKEDQPVKLSWWQRIVQFFKNLF